MAYQHILVAVDLSDESEVLIQHAAALATPLNAKLSLIHIDVNYAELYTGFIDINLAETQHKVAEEAREKLSNFTSKINYPINHTLLSSGDFSQEVCTAIKEYSIDLVVCGHHQDFWSKLLSTSRQLIDCSTTHLLVVPFK